MTVIQPQPEKAEHPLSDFEEDLCSLINRHSLENLSDTPDFILAQFLIRCLASYNLAVTRRENWYGRTPVSVPPDQCPALPNPVNPNSTTDP